MMFLSLIAIIWIGSLLVRRTARLEGNAAYGRAPGKSVRAYVDGKPVDSDMKED